METKLQSKKRKEQPPSNPFVGVFSRSKSQIYVHQNRSGRARIDTVPKQLHHQILIPPTPSRKRKAIKDPEAVNPQILSRTPVKDLRARRVFSPGASIGENCSPDGGNGNPKSKADCDVKGSDSLEMNCSPTNSVVEKCSKEGKLVIDLSPSGRDVIVGNDCRSKVSEVTNPNLSVAEEGEAQKNQNDKDDCPMAEEDGQRKASVSIAPKLDETFMANVNGINNESLGSQANHKSKWVVSSCTRQKVFKSPGSFSYRRMLPFLQDISADDSGVSNIEKPGLGDNSNAQSLDKTNLKAADVVSNGVDEMGEGDVQTTPPDWDIIFRAEVKDNRRNGNGTGMQTHDLVSRTPLKGIIKRNDRFMPEGYPRPANLKTEYSPMSKSVLTPCSSRIKKLKTVSSFSYRRLLPYLMESRNRDSDISSDISRCAQPLKVEDASENKIPGPALVSRFADIPNGTSKTDYSSAASTLTCETGLLTNDLALTSDEKIESIVLSESLKECTSQVEKCLSNKPEKVESVLKDFSSILDESCVDTDCETPNEHDKLKPATSLKDSTLLDGKIAEDGKIIEALNLAEDAEISQVDEVIQKIYKSMELEPAPLTLALGTTADLESPLKNSPSPSKNTPSPSKNSPSPSKDTPSPSKNSPSPSKNSPSPSKNSPSPPNISGDLSLVSQEAKDGKTSEAVSSDETLSLLKDVPSGNVVDGRARGILRRNPRGCRGLCDCLSCSSFRLHADKAFEFSKNQFLDAEEVAEELIKEMSHLRDMLEKCTSDGSGHASLCASQEVKAACLKASKAEELAKDRLSEMNSELTIHCRTMQLQRPKVRFANHVQEATIPKISDKNKIEDRR